jgi:hypothetical protein
LELLYDVWGSDGAATASQVAEVDGADPTDRPLLHKVAAAAGVPWLPDRMPAFDIASVRWFASRALAMLDIREAR